LKFAKYAFYRIRRQHRKIMTRNTVIGQGGSVLCLVWDFGTRRGIYGVTV